MRASDASTVPRWRERPTTFLALFVLAVGLILGSLPGWELCFAAWAALAGLALFATAFGLGCCAAFEAWRRRGRHARSDLAQVGFLVVAVALFWPMHYLSRGVVLASVFSELHRAAAALPDDAGPRFAWRETDEYDDGNDGYAYDPSGQILLPRAARSPSWQRRVDGTPFAKECWHAQHVVGAYYRWDSNGCG
jgi:hypothetical protein